MIYKTNGVKSLLTYMLLIWCAGAFGICSFILVGAGCVSETFHIVGNLVIALLIGWWGKRFPFIYVFVSVTSFSVIWKLTLGSPWKDIILFCGGNILFCSEKVYNQLEGISPREYPLLELARKWDMNYNLNGFEKFLNDHKGLLVYLLQNGGEALELLNTHTARWVNANLYKITCLEG